MKTMRSADVSRGEPRTTSSAEASIIKTCCCCFKGLSVKKYWGLGALREGDVGKEAFSNFFFLFFNVLT